MKDNVLVKLIKNNEEYIVGVYSLNEANFVRKNLKKFLCQDVEVKFVEIKNKVKK